MFPFLLVATDTLGINAHVPSAEVVDLVADLGTIWMRVDNNWLSQTDPCSDAIGWEPALDAAVTRAGERDVKVYMTLAYTPACGSSGGADADGHNDVPTADAYGAYVRRAVAHYRAMGVTHFGLWNEPNLDHFFEGTAAQYVANVVVPGMAAIDLGCADAGHTDCRGLGPDVAHVGDYDVFLEGVLADLRDRGLMFDILAHHIYNDFDTAAFDGDNFYNALEMRRFSFTRRSMRDVLVDVGLTDASGAPTIEVWITETGWKATPPTDAGQMASQRDHVIRVADAQLERAWWTNSFFYEIVDSGDELDGFGITRRDGAGFLHKPAYDDLQAKIAADPRLRGEEPATDDPDAGPTDSDDPDAGPGATGTDAGVADEGAVHGGCSTGGDGSGALLVLAALVGCRRRYQITPRG